MTAAEMEEVVLGVWQEVLQRTDLDPEQEFFAAGGTADQVEPMLRLVVERTGRSVPDSQRFLRHQTASALASMLSESSSPQDADTPRVILLRQANGAGLPPIFYVAPPEQDVTGFRRVAKLLLAGGAVFGVQPGRQVYFGGTAFDVEDAVSRMVSAVQAAAGGEPILLAGYCFGGTLAYMAAERLPGCVGVILLDSPTAGAPVPHCSTAFLGSARRYVREARQTHAEDRLLDRPSRMLMRKALWHTLRLSRGILKTHWQHGSIARLRRIATFHEVPCICTLPRLQLPILLLTAEQPGSMNMRWGVEDWRQHHGGSMTVQMLPGDHAGVFFRRNVPLLADAIATWAGTLHV